jgi:hypothetical protein
MFRRNAVARQQEVKRLSVDTLAFPTVLRSVGWAIVRKATIAWLLLHGGQH